MKPITVILTLCALGSPLTALSQLNSATRLENGPLIIPHEFSSKSHGIKGYVKKNGTYVPRSQATNPNKSKRDNWTAKGNTNPYTGKKGTKDPQKSPQQHRL